MKRETGLGRGWSLGGAILAVGLYAAPASAAPAVARGEQFLPVSQQECLLWAQRAFVGEGWKTFGAEGTWVGAFKGIHSAYITCNVSTSEQVVVNIFVASQAPEGDVPGRERVLLQERMAAAAPSVPPSPPAATAPQPAAPPQPVKPPAAAAPAAPTARPAAPSGSAPPALPPTAAPAVSAPPPMPPGAAPTARPVTPPAATATARPAPAPAAPPTTARPAPPPTGPAAPKGTDPMGIEWDEWEGHYQGVWTRRGTTNVWDASWGSVKAVLTLTVQGNQVRVQRRHGSDGNICDYQGVIEADGVNVQGSFNCVNGASNVPWRAVIRR